MRASSNSFATLRLDMGGQDGRAARGAALACAAQLRAEALDGGGALLFEVERWLASVEHGLCGSGDAWEEWEALVDADAPGALAALLGSDDAGDANYPLEFGVTAHDLDGVAHPGTGGQTLVALRICARLCALDSADHDEEAVQAALRRLLLAGLIDDANDAAAATLVADAARRRLAALEDGAIAAAALRRAGAVRTCCVELAEALRRSEAHALERVRDEAATIFSF